MSATQQRVLRLARSDAAGEAFVLIHVQSSGPHPLDLALSASEGDYSYFGSLKQSEIRSIRAQNYNATAEWEAALSSTLLLEQLPGDLACELEGLECVASVSPGKLLSIVWRRNIGGITQRLGALELKCSEDEFDLWALCALGAQSFAQARHHVGALEAQLSEQASVVKKLQEQLQSLTEAKVAHENALLHKFSELLNSKKSKIRDQQRLLSTAKVDPEAVERVQNTRPQTKPRAAEPSRTSKRKAVARAPESEEESSDGFEDVPKEVAENEEDPDQGQVTPDATEDETEDEDDVVSAREPTPPPPPKKGVRKGVGGKGKGKAAESNDPEAAESGMALRQKANDMDMDVDDVVIPPRRELPFASKRKAAQAASQKIADEAPKARNASQPSHLADDDDTDDEL